MGNAALFLSYQKKLTDNIDERILRSLLTLHLIHPDTAFVGGRLEDAVDAGDVGGGEGGG